MRQRSPLKTAITAGIAGVVLLMMLTAQVHYSLTDEGIQVKYRYLVLLPLSSRIIDYDTIQSAEVLQQLPSSRKLVGFSSFGRLLIGSFRSDAIGDFQAYIQNTRIPQLLIRTNDKTYVLSPNEAEVFAQQVRGRIKH